MKALLAALIAAAPASAPLQGAAVAPDGVARFTGHQGRFVERPGIVDVEVTAAGRRATGVRVSGNAVIVYEAELPVGQEPGGRPDARQPTQS